MVRGGGVGIGAILVALVVGATPAFAQPSVPGSLALRRVEYAGLQVNVATLRTGVRFALQPKQADASVTSLVPVAAACRPCVAAVNGDFFNPATRQPIGGVIIDGIVLRSPNVGQNQLTIAHDGRISAGNLAWQGELSALDGTTMPVAVNDPSAGSAIVYDAHFGAPTPLRSAVELVFAQRSAAGLRLDRTLHFRFIGLHAPGQPVPPGRIVVSASGFYGKQLAELRRKLRTGRITPTITMSLTTEPGAWNSLGANLILLRAGQVVPINAHDDFEDGPHPRTIFGWNSRNQVTLVTIGSSVPGRGGGVSLSVATRILSGLGVTNAVNLDGGGSSTFVSNGRVLNNPSDGIPRAVTNAWIVIARRGPKRLARVARPTRLRRRVRVVTRKRPVVRPSPARVVVTARPVAHPTTTVARVAPSPNAARVALPVTPIHAAPAESVTVPKSGHHLDQTELWVALGMLGAASLTSVMARKRLTRKTNRRRRVAPEATV